MGAKGLCQNTISAIRSRFCRLASVHRRFGSHRRTASRVSHLFKGITCRLTTSQVLLSALHPSSTRIPVRDESPRICDLASLQPIQQISFSPGHRRSPMKIISCNHERCRRLKVEEPLTPQLYLRHHSVWLGPKQTKVLLRIVRLQHLPF
jgi:hypothetical protein